MEHDGDVDTNCNWGARNNRPSFAKETKRFRNQWTSRDYPDQCVIKIGQNTEKLMETRGNMLSLKHY